MKKYSNQSIAISATAQLADVKGKMLFATFFFAIAIAIAGQSIAQSKSTNGIAEYIEFNNPTLLIKLELETPTDSASQAIESDMAKQLSFRILEDRTPRRWAQIWIQNLSINNGPDALTKQTDDLIKMTQALPSGLKQGDLVEFERVSDDMTLMILDGIELAEFNTPGFFEFLLSGFIGSIPPSSDLKNALLGNGNTDADAETLFNSMSYSLARTDQIESWIAPIEEIAEVEVAVEEPAVEEAPEPTPVAAAPAPVVEEPVIEEPVVVAVVEPTPVPVAPPAPAPAPEPEPEDAPVIITAESLLAVQNYQRAMLVKIYKNIAYPRRAERANREGALRISVSVNKDGSLEDVAFLESAEYDGFNDAAVEAVEDASPFDSLPEAVFDLPMTVEIPIQFVLQ